MSEAEKENVVVTSVSAKDDVINVTRQDLPATPAKETEAVDTPKAESTVQDGTAENTVGEAEPPVSESDNVAAEVAEEPRIPPNFFQTAKFTMSAAAISQEHLNDMVKRLADLAIACKNEFEMEVPPNIKIEVMLSSGTVSRHEVLFVPKKLGGGYRVTQL